MFKSVFLTSVLLGLSYGSPETLMKIKQHLNSWNWDVACWGESNVVKHREMETETVEKCMSEPVNPLMKGHSQAVTPKMLALMSSPTMQYAHHIPSNFQQMPASTYSLGYPYPNLVSPFKAHYGKRSAGDMTSFMENAADFKDGVESKMSNLSCVLQSMGAIDADFKINREIFTTDIWKMQDLYATDNLADPVWRAKMTTMFTDCIDLAESIPQAFLDNNPLTRMMGPLARFMKFNMCKKMCTKHLCGAAQAARLVEKFHGAEMNFDASEFGVQDKYEKAMMVAMVMTESESPEKEFINTVFHGEM